MPPPPGGRSWNPHTPDQTPGLPENHPYFVQIILFNIYEVNLIKLLNKSGQFNFKLPQIAYCIFNYIKNINFYALNLHFVAKNFKRASIFGSDPLFFGRCEQIKKPWTF